MSKNALGEMKEEEASDVNDERNRVNIKWQGIIIQC